MTFQINIILFGPARELVGSERIRIDVRPVMTTAEIIKEIIEVRFFIK